MATLLTKVCFVFLALETFIGMVANGSIVLINFIDWFRRRKLSPADLILICLGLSRLCLQAVMILDVTLLILLNHTLDSVVIVLFGAWTFTNSVNVWFAAWLSVFYLVKIAIFSHPVFLHVKQRFSGLVPRLLLGSVVFSVVLTIITTLSWIYGLSACNPHRSLSSNLSGAEISMPQKCRYTFALKAAFNFIPVMAFLLSSFFLISSLWKHMRRMQSNGTGTGDLNMQAHLCAIKVLASFAFLYFLSFATTTLQSLLTWNNLTWNNQHTWATLLFNVNAVYPIGHAILLILNNPKLKQAWVKMLQHFKYGSWYKSSRNFEPMQETTGGAGMSVLG